MKSKEFEYINKKETNTIKTMENNILLKSVLMFDQDHLKNLFGRINTRKIN